MHPVLNAAVRQISFGAAAVLAVLPPALAEEYNPVDGYYGSGALALVIPAPGSTVAGGDIHAGQGPGLHAAVGYAYRNARAETEFGVFNVNGDDSGDLAVYSLMFNVYYDWHTGSPWTPYVGGGVGLAVVEYDTLRPGGPGPGPLNGTDAAFAWQLLTGLEYAFNQQSSLYAGYRYFTVANATARIEDDGHTGVRTLPSHQIELGVRYRF